MCLSTHLLATPSARIRNRKQHTLARLALLHRKPAPLEQILAALRHRPLQFRKFRTSFCTAHNRPAVFGNRHDALAVRTEVQVVGFARVQRNIVQQLHARKRPHSDVSVGAAGRHQFAAGRNADDALQRVRLEKIGLHTVAARDVEHNAIGRRLLRTARFGWHVLLSAAANLRHALPCRSVDLFVVDVRRRTSSRRRSTGDQRLYVVQLAQVLLPGGQIGTVPVRCERTIHDGIRIGLVAYAFVSHEFGAIEMDLEYLLNQRHVQ